ncbi:hypothetical protein FZC84_01160 [Rossellomorea vietnamensis]|uniref:Integral membrane protein n=1 Tax=Rossellomorea vietnamensis TaxID=218284 RepID=A0A5D4MI97_9BACI|nr:MULTISPECIES: VC0807 family protein [Bacillaceae]TYS01297.1 hypothetical protein FZC84_01160 [Rossellomorea vietnamensis]
MRNAAVLDILFYFVFPVMVWNYTKEPLGDYYAMLLSAVPGILYTLYRFIKFKRINVFGIFIISTLIVSTTVDLLSGSGINLLWNNVYFHVGLGGFFFITLLLNKPIVLYFSLDFAELQGYDRTSMKTRFYQKDVINIFRLITIGFGLRSFILAGLKVWLIKEYGVNAFDKGLLAENIISWGMTGLCFYGLIVINKRLQHPKKEASSKIS